MLRRIQLVFFCLVIGGVATAGPIVTLYPSIGPDFFFNSASWQQYQANTVYALENGLSSWGTPGTPSYYQQISAFWPNQVFGTDFPSWMGQVPPPAGFEGETGNALVFGLAVNGNGDPFTLGSITYDEVFFGMAAPTYSFAGQTFANYLVGVYFGPDRTPGTADDIRYDQLNPGNSGVPIDVLYFSGNGVQFYASDPADLASSIALIAGSSSAWASGTYTVDGTAGGAVVTMIPEPSTLELGGIAFAFICVAFRRKKK